MTSELMSHDSINYTLIEYEVTKSIPTTIPTSLILEVMELIAYLIQNLEEKSIQSWKNKGALDLNCSLVDEMLSNKNARCTQILEAAAVFTISVLATVKKVQISTVAMHTLIPRGSLLVELQHRTEEPRRHKSSVTALLLPVCGTTAAITAPAETASACA